MRNTSNIETRNWLESVEFDKDYLVEWLHEDKADPVYLFSDRIYVGYFTFSIFVNLPLGNQPPGKSIQNAGIGIKTEMDS